MAPTNLQPIPGDLILRTRPGLNARKGRMESRHWLDTFGHSARSATSYETREQALAAGHEYAATDGLAVREDVTSVTCPSQRLRLEVSFRRAASHDL